MRSVRTTRRWLWAAAGTLALASVAVVVWAVRSPVTTPTAPADGDTRVSLISAGDTAERGIPLDQIQALSGLNLQRPLFDPPPPPPPAPVKPPPPPPLRVRLVGTVIEPSGSQAILMTSDGTLKFMQLGQTLEGATIERIDPDRVEVRYHDQAVTLEPETR